MIEEVKSPLIETPMEKGERFLKEVSSELPSWIANGSYGVARKALRNLITEITIMLFEIENLERKNHEA